jgi:type VI secretion system protein VasD
MAGFAPSKGAWTLASALAVGLAACGSPPKPPPPTVVAGSIEAAAQLNPTAARRPSPMQLRIYELKSAAAFGSADFMSLFQGDQAALGPEMVAREELTLQPGETRPYNKTLNADTRFIGVVAAYRDLERATWRTLVPVQLNRTQKLTIRAGELAVSATVAP